MSGSLRLTGVTKRELTNIALLKDWPAMGVDAHGRPVFVNQAAEVCLGREASQIKQHDLPSLLLSVEDLLGEHGASVAVPALGIHNARVALPQGGTKSVVILSVPVLEQGHLTGLFLCWQAFTRPDHLASLKRLLGAVLDKSAQAVVLCDESDTVGYVSDGFVRGLGYDADALAQVGGPYYLLTEPEDCQRWLSTDQQESMQLAETELLDAGGNISAATVLLKPIYDSQDNVLAKAVIYGGVSGLRMVTTDRADGVAEAAVPAWSMSRAQLVLSRITEAVFSLDLRGRIEYLNAPAEQLVGISLAQARGRLFDDVVYLHEEGDVAARIEQVVSPCLYEAKEICLTEGYALQRGMEREYAVELRASPVTGKNDRVEGVVVVITDISEKRSIEKQIHYQASHDALTGLINRREFESRINHAIMEARLGGQEFTLLVLDLDRFKVINDTCGHVAGDVLLKQITALIYATLKDEGDFMVARLGGDEFGVLLRGRSENGASELGEKLCVALQQFRFQWFERKYELGASIGIALVNANTSNHAEALSAAESSCLLAKDRGRRRVHVYQDNDAELLQRKGEMQWMHRIRHALDNNQFCLYHQKIHPLSVARHRGAQSEVLVRLIDEGGGIVPPEAFIMAAERYQLMPDVDRWVIDNAFSILGKKAQKQDGKRFYINLSGQTIGNGNFLDYVVERTRRNAIAPEQICFEVTETAAIDNFDTAASFIRVLREMGYQFALDDFGSGMSSYGYLKQLPVDYIKIDGSFVRDILRDETNHALVESINHMGHVMGVETIAEFVEDDDTLRRLWEIGVDHVQGYGVSRPTPLWQSLNTTRH